MTRRTRWLCVLPVAGLCAAAAGGQAVSSQTPSTDRKGAGVIVGRVVDGRSGASVSGVVVAITGGPVAARSGAAQPDRVGTDADGRFFFSGLPTGTYDLTVTKLGYAESGYGQRRPGGTRLSLELTEGQRITDLSIRIWKLGWISGAVLDDGNEPVVGAMVRALRWSVVAGRRRLVAAGTARTDDRGAYRIGSLLPGEYVSALPATQTAIPISVYETYWRNTTNTELRAAITSTGAGIWPPGSIQSSRIGDSVLIRQPFAALPPDHSETSRPSVFPTTFHPGAMSPSQAGTVSIVGEGRAGVDIRLRLQPSVNVSGVLSDRDGPARLQAIRLIPRWTDELSADAGFEGASTLTDAAGAFTFIGVLPGQYSLRSSRVPRPAAPLRGVPGPGPIPDAPAMYALEPITVGGSDLRVTATLRAGLRVSGRFSFVGVGAAPPGDRLRQVPIVIEPADGRSSISVPPGQGDPAGTFATYGMPPGRYFIRVGGAPPGWTVKSVVFDGRDVTDTAIDLQDADATDVIITFSDRPTQLSGIVRSADGRVDTDASVVVFPVDPQAWIDVGVNPRRLRSARVTSAGAFNFANLPAGDYLLAATPDEGAAAWQDPKFLETLARRATRVSVADGDKKTQDLTVIR